jgi:nucleoside permease NupC
MSDLAARMTSLGGLFVMLALALAFGENRRRISLRLVLRTIISGTLAAFMTACFAGMLT